MQDRKTMGLWYLVLLEMVWEVEGGMQARLANGHSFQRQTCKYGPKEEMIHERGENKLVNVSVEKHKHFISSYNHWVNKHYWRGFEP